MRTGYTPQLSFVQGYIEQLSAIPTGSIDIVISNCVINLSPRKDLVLAEVHRVLKEGGEFFFSDVYCDRRLPAAVREHKLLWGECIAGALYLQDFLRLSREVGFADPRTLETSVVSVDDPELADVVGNAKFTSVTFRLFKIKSLESLCEDYGQVAVYKGTIAGHAHSYLLDDHHRLETGRPMLVCGNTASMLSESWLAPHFTVTGDRSVHHGLFDCSTAPKASIASATAQCGPAVSGGGACGSSGGCC